MNITYNLTSDISGQCYQELLNYSLKFCNQFILVVRHNTEGMMQIDLSKCAVIGELKPFLIKSSEESEWPGTILIEHKATVLRYRYNKDSLKILQQSASSLYAWEHPNLPEDLCLFRPSGEVWLTIIAHENDGYFEMTEDEYSQLLDEIPILRQYLSTKQEYNSGDIRHNLT